MRFFLLVPLSTDLEPSDSDIEYYFNYIINKLEKIENNIRDTIKVKMSYTRKNFINDYNAFR